MAGAVTLSAAAGGGVRIAILHPLEGAVFPLDFTPPDSLWEDSSAAQQWSLVFRFESGTNEIRVLSDGVRPAVEVDDRCRREDGEPYAQDRFAMARGWRPSAEIWRAIQRASVEQLCTLTIRGVGAPADGANAATPLSEKERCRSARPPIPSAPSSATAMCR